MLFTYRSALTLLFIFSITGCFASATIVRDETGTPVFDETQVRHPANEPYFCFTLVDSRGDERKQCEVIKDWCVQAINKSKGSGLTILSGCREVDQVSCFVAYGTGGMITSATSFCWETPQDCEGMREVSAQQNGSGNVSGCQALDRSFQPSK
jgi:hypothetical protein